MFTCQVRRVVVLTTLMAGSLLTTYGIALADDDNDAPLINAPININMCGNPANSPGMISGLSPTCTNATVQQGKKSHHHR